MKKMLTAILRFFERLIFVPVAQSEPPQEKEAKAPEAPREDPATKEAACAKRLREGIQRGFPHKWLKRYGCYFFALLRWSEEIRGRGWMEKDVVCLFEQARARTMPDPKNPGKRIPVITKKGFVNDPVRLLNFLAGKSAVREVSLWTNDGNHPTPPQRIFAAREKHPRHGAHFVLVIDGQRWDSLPLDGRVPAGFQVLT